jgi:hypothetical protein
MSVDITEALYQVPAGVTSEMYLPVVRGNVSELTTGEIDGQGVFDRLMSSMNAHIKGEFEKGRITGAQYTQAYIELTQAALTTALQFILNREQSFWASQQAQIAAVNARVGLETARYNYSITLPFQTALLTKQVDQAQVAYDTATYNLAITLPKQTMLLETQNDAAIRQIELSNQQIMLTEAQKFVAAEQKDLLREQTQVQRAQTMDTRLDGVTPVAGTVAKQKALFEQQVIAYRRDSEVKAGKLFTDGWTVQKTVNEDLLAPAGFTNSDVGQVLTKIMENNGFTTPTP